VIDDLVEDPSPDDLFDAVELMYQTRAEEVPAPSLKHVASAEACPQCRCTHLMLLGNYRKCAMCGHQWQAPQAGESGVVV
jgi:hypothetical protein